MPIDDCNSPFSKIYVFVKFHSTFLIIPTSILLNKCLPVVKLQKNRFQDEVEVRNDAWFPLTGAQIAWNHCTRQSVQKLQNGLG